MPIYLLVKSLVKSFIKKAIEKRSYYSDTPGKFALLKELKRNFLQIFVVDSSCFCNFVDSKAMFVGFIRTVIIFNYDISATSIAPSTAGECCQPQPQ